VNAAAEILIDAQAAKIARLESELAGIRASHLGVLSSVSGHREGVVMIDGATVRIRPTNTELKNMVKRAKPQSDCGSVCHHD
jgi:hypothetical protein